MSYYVNNHIALNHLRLEEMNEVLNLNYFYVVDHWNMIHRDKEISHLDNYWVLSVVLLYLQKPFLSFTDKIFDQTSSAGNLRKN